jgi:hypothetical protein
MQRKLLGTINVDFDETGQLMIIYFAFIKCLKKWEYNEAVSQIFTRVNLKKVYDSVRRKVLYCSGQWQLSPFR